MPDNDADLLGSLDGPNASYPPFENIKPYPKFLVINLYLGYILTNDKLICITHPDQTSIAKRLQSALRDIGFTWEIRLHQLDEGRENVGVQFELKPLKHGAGAYEIEIEDYIPDDEYYKDGIMSLIAHDIAGLDRGVTTLIQVIQLAFEKFGDAIVSMWIKDWEAT